jgi:hypothetical protein
MQKRQYVDLLIESMVKRAIAKSDPLIKEIFERVEGHVPNDPAASMWETTDTSHRRMKSDQPA